MHIYAFGSVCRGEIDEFSDIDMLAIVDGEDSRFNSSDYSVYSYNRINELWNEGNPFAWHLSLESRFIHGSDKTDYLKQLGSPNQYKNGIADCQKFADILNAAKTSIETSSYSEVFDLSAVFLSVRNFATCYSLYRGNNPDFSRNSALNLGEDTIPLGPEIYSVLEQARVLSTRGIGEMISIEDLTIAKGSLGKVKNWMSNILEKMEKE